MEHILCILATLSAVHSGPFDANWTTTIFDPARPTHEIPIGVSFPMSGGPYPVVIFTHGWEGRVRWYNYVYDNMVPHGYVVAVPASEESLLASATTLATDARYLLDFLVASSKNRTSPVYNKIGTKFFIAGHSMGGEAAILAATNYNLKETFNNEFDGLMTLSACGGKTEQNQLKTMTKPAFIMSGSSDCTCNPNTTSIPFYNALQQSPDKCKYLAIIQDGIHCFFCDFDYDHDVQAHIDECLVLMPPCGGKLEMHTQINIINRYMLQFMNAVVSNRNQDFTALTQTLQKDAQNGVMSQAANNCTL